MYNETSLQRTNFASPFALRYQAVISRFNAWHDGCQKQLLGCINGL